MTIKVFTVAEMVAAEKAADAAGHSYAAMMEVAGRRVAEAILERWDVSRRQILVLVGPGNNGGDGLVAGRFLAEAGAEVAFYLSKPRDPSDDKNLALVTEAGLEVLLAEHDQRYRVLRHRLRITNIVVDALLGTGLTRTVSGEMAELMRQVNAGIAEQRTAYAESLRPVLISIAALPPGREDGNPNRLPPPTPVVVAVDCPSGLNCDTGALDPLAQPAHLTVTFAGPKQGHLRFPGAAACGELVVADIGISPSPAEVAAVKTELATAAGVAVLLTTTARRMVTRGRSARPSLWPGRHSTGVHRRCLLARRCAPVAGWWPWRFRARFGRLSPGSFLKRPFRQSATRQRLVRRARCSC